MKDHHWVQSRGKRLSVMLHLPDNYHKEKPLILCCHGFTGDKVGANQLTLNLASTLEEKGYVVVRFDYLGSGDSDGSFKSDTFVSGWREDLENTINWVKSDPRLEYSPIILYGHSLGGLIVLLHEDLHNVISARIVFAPVIRPIENFRDIILGPDLWERSLAGETIANFYGKSFTLERQFVHELVSQNYNPIGNANKLSTPLLIIHGTKDSAVPIDGSVELYNAYQGQKKFIQLETDHLASNNNYLLQEVIIDWLPMALGPTEEK